MGYRHVPLSSRLGLSFNEESYWRVDMEEAECFMHFIAGLRQVFGDKDVLYMEGAKLDPEVEAFYREADQPQSKVTPLLRHAKSRAYHVPLTRANHGKLSRFAASKTFEGLCDALLVYRDGKVLLDGSRIGERLALFSSEIPESAVKRFSRTKVHGACQWVGL